MRQKLGLGNLLLLLFLIVHTPAQAQGFKVTSGNAVHLGTGWAEITTVAFGPGENPSCPDGRLFFATGHAVLATDLNGKVVAWPNPAESPNPRGFGYNETVPNHPIRDNHLVKLKDGSLLFTAEAITWKDVGPDKPAWWGLTAEFPLKERSHPGGRAIIYVHRSADCGRTWSPAGDVDAATLVVPDPSGTPVQGFCGTPRLFKTEKMVGNPGTPKVKVPIQWSEGGGWDGHYLYADPYSGNLFLTTPCHYGTGNMNEGRTLALFLMSSDRGDSWKVVARIDTQKEWVDAWRMPVTSLPNGVVAFGYVTGKELKVALVAPPYDDVDLQPKSVSSLQSGALLPETGINTNISGHPVLARLPGRGFLASTFDRQPEGSGTKLTQRFFDLRLIPLPLPGKGVAELPKIVAAGDRDVVHGTFIEGTPATDLHVFYWAERTAVRGVSQLRVKYQVYKGTTALLKQPGELTIARGKPYTYGAKEFIGDYMSGASYTGQDGSQRFVAAWSEQGVVRFNTISVSPQILSAKAPGPVDAQIVSQPLPLQQVVLPSPAGETPKPARGRPTP